MNYIHVLLYFDRHGNIFCTECRYSKRIVTTAVGFLALQEVPYLKTLGKFRKLLGAGAICPVFVQHSRIPVCDHREALPHMLTNHSSR